MTTQFPPGPPTGAYPPAGYPPPRQRITTTTAALAAIAAILVVALVATLLYVFVLRDTTTIARYEAADFTTTTPFTDPALIDDTLTTAAGETIAEAGTCNPTKLKTQLAANPSAAAAWAQIIGIKTTEINTYIDTLHSETITTPLQVTNHDYESGQPRQLQSVLDTGTAVLVDNKGIPRVRCACGNPLKPAKNSATDITGAPQGFDLNNVATKPAKDDYTKPVPVLGRDKFDTSGWATGFGTAKPGGFSIASTASSTVGDITWESWGGDTAIGLGRTQDRENPQYPDEQRSDMWVLAYDLGWCNGVWTYRSIFRSRDRAGLNPTGDDGTEICNGSRAAPSNEPVTLGPDSLLTFGGAGGVYVGDPGSKIPNTYVKKNVITTPGMYPYGTIFYDFRENTFDAQTLTSPNVAEVWVNEEGIILQFRWSGTDRGIKIGSPAADIEKAYADAERRTCRLGLTPTPYFVDKAGRAVLFIISDNKVRGIRAIEPSTGVDPHCPFE